jgi:hypothetical protein
MEIAAGRCDDVGDDYARGFDRELGGLADFIGEAGRQDGGNRHRAAAGAAQASSLRTSARKLSSESTPESRRVS